MMPKKITALFVLFITISGHSALSQSRAKVVNIDKSFKLGVKAYVYGYPLVLMEMTGQALYRGYAKNWFYHNPAFPTAGSKKVVRPNVDTLYSTAWLLLSQGPVVMSVPEMDNRYYLVQMIDAWTETFAVVGTRSTGTKAGQFAIVGPEWEGIIPKHMMTIRASTNRVWLAGRIQTNWVTDYSNVHALQQNFLLEPLNDEEFGIPSIISRPSYLPDSKLPPPLAVEKMNAFEFFTVLTELMKHTRPRAEDAPLIASFKSIGIVPGKIFDASGLDDETRHSLELAAVEAQHQISQRFEVLGKRGWTSRNNVGRFGTDYLARARVARHGIAGLPTEDAIYISTNTDSNDRPLNGTNAYLLHFDKNTIPPVNAFWSITLYNSEGYFVDNDLNRYALGDRDQLSFNEDGSFDIYVQKNSPPDAQMTNWLPAPNGPFSLTMRLYWPKPEARDKWEPPDVQQRP